ncbi:flavoprotein [Haliangium ochraceum]|uniref:Flavoprotein n=1 Tax=Haliangium ochraceum (strain DSM 14365 / JCM 11303 / SMP-2) TaxID=502025 RepID=D0LZP0_HALO1|nr:flavoprotein [Haliangium ochraceum]ACY18019.1 flavoprotein [Haliangium ochraceum DSM 14365]
MSSDGYYLRNPEVSAIARGEGYLFVRPGRERVLLSPVDVEALARALDALCQPLPEAAVAELLEREVLARLVASEVVLTGSREALRARLSGGEAGSQAQKAFRHLVVALAGEPACVPTAWQLVHLRRDCEELDVIVSEAAQRLVEPAYLRRLGLRVWTDAFAARGAINVPHIHLARAAEMLVIMPASAYTLYQLAHGECSDLLSLTATATDAPVVVVPSMSASAWASPAVARNAAQLREDGFYVVSPRAQETAADAPDESDLDAGGIPLGELSAVLQDILAVHGDGDGLV